MENKFLPHSLSLKIMLIWCLQLCHMWIGLLYWALSLLQPYSSSQWHLWLFWYAEKVFHTRTMNLCFLIDTLMLLWNLSFPLYFFPLFSESSSQRKETKVMFLLPHWAYVRPVDNHCASLSRMILYYLWFSVISQSALWAVFRGRNANCKLVFFKLAAW